MKRDLNVIRYIFDYVENSTADIIEPSDMVSDSYDLRTINHHIKLLADQHYVEIIDASTLSGEYYLIKSITMRGYDYLDSIHEQDSDIALKKLLDYAEANNIWEDILGSDVGISKYEAQLLRIKGFITFCEDITENLFITLTEKGLKRNFQHAESHTSSTITYNIHNLSNSIIGNQQNATVSVHSSNVDKYLEFIDSIVEQDRETAKEVIHILSDMQNNKTPKSKNLLQKFSGIISKYSFLIEAVAQVIPAFFAK